MSDLNSQIPDYSYGSILGPSSLPEVEQTTAKDQKPDSSLSTIEKSEAIASLMVPPANFPLLIPPSNNNQDYLAFAVASIDSSGKPFVDLLKSEQLKMDEITNEVLDGWLKNLHDIEDQVRAMINSADYQYREQIRIKGDQHQGNVSGIQDVTSANAAAANPTVANQPSYAFLGALDRLQVLERLPPTASVSETSEPSDQTRMVIIPLTAALIIGGGLALTATNMTTPAVNGMSSNAFSNPIELIERLQPVYPQIAMQDVIPMINLMVMPPIYFNAWDEAVSNIKERERDSHVETAQNFAKDVIKMVSDPAFIMVTFVNKMEGAEKMNTEAKNRMATMLKLILASVALSLLYSVEVGKVQSGKYGGMEPQEFRDILNGTIAGPDPSKQKTTQEQLTATLLTLIKGQLDSGILTQNERAQTIEEILNYIGQSHSIESMLDPVKVFTQVLAFDDPSKKLENRPA